MNVAFENNAYFRFLDDLDDIGMLEKMDDLHAQLSENVYDAVPDETITISVVSEAYAYVFHFDVMAYEDMDEGYIDIEEKPLMLCYRSNTVLER